MLRGGSLFYALAVAVIIGLVSASLLLTAGYNDLRRLNDERSERVVRNVQSGIELLLADREMVDLGEPHDVDLFGEGQDSVTLERKAWGAFEVLIARAHTGASAFQRVALSGFAQAEDDRTALILADMDRPLSIAGKTRLEGTCHLPKAGVQRAYIEGQSYSGDRLVYGETKTAGRFLPGYNDTLVKCIAALFTFIPASDEMIGMEEFFAADSIANSFTEEPLFIFSEADIVVSGKTIAGQVCILSRGTIRVMKDAVLHQAMLVAPKIVLEKGTAGDFQAFARDSLIAGEDVQLDYPSVLGVIGTAQSPDMAALVLDKNAKLSGQLFACSTAKDYRKHVMIKIGTEATVHGQVYSSDLAEHRGTLNGGLTCAKFTLKTNSAEYDNHLLNAKIDRNALPEAFVASALTCKSTDRKAIVQWLE